MAAFQSLFAAAVDQGKGTSEFWKKYYLRYFADLNAKGFTAPFVYTGASSWIRQNWADVQKMLAWSRAYDWTATSVPDSRPSPAPASSSGE